MWLGTYLNRSGKTPTSFARECRVAVSTITRILRGERAPRSSTMRRIRAVSGGAVAALSDFERPKPRPIRRRRGDAIAARVADG